MTKRWLVGDIQGCFQALKSLLEAIDFRPGIDQLYPLGDLINRGDDDLRTLDLLYRHRDSVFPILGNHDLHMLAAYTLNQPPRKSDTFAPILNSQHADQYCKWLISQPLVRYFKDRDLLVSHAGIPAIWSAEQALALNNEIQSCLNSERKHEYFASMYGNLPEKWNEQLEGLDRLRVITNYLTRMRFVHQDSRLDLTHKGEIDSAPSELVPWFNIGRDDELQIAFGHWAALEGSTHSDFAHSLDGGCVWGGTLIAMDLDNGERISVRNPLK